MNTDLQTSSRFALKGLRRSVLKAISWRILGSIDTFLLSALVIKLNPFALPAANEHGQSGILEVAAAIAILEVATKLVLYTCHEQLWQKIGWGRLDARNTLNELRRRSIVKTALWRVIAFIDTTIIAFVFIGSASAALTIGVLEILTKMALYYVHERLWLRVPTD